MVGGRPGRGIVAIAGCALVVTLAACAGSGGKSGDTHAGGKSGGTSGSRPTLNYAAGNRPTSLDPRQAALYDTPYINLIYDPLIRRNPAGKLVPDLATSWKFGADTKSLMLTLRSGVKFQDGTTFDADAVKQNLLAAQKKGYATAAPLSPITSIDVTDATHLTLNFSAPNASMTQVLAGFAGSMISPKSLTDASKKPVGAGPFTLTGQSESEWQFTAWSGYWNAKRIKLGAINIREISDDPTRLNALTSGQVDAAQLFAPQVPPAKQAGMKIASGHPAFMYALWMNAAKAPFNNAKVRLALTHAIDRQAISDGGFGGACEPLIQPFPKGYWAHTDTLSLNSSLGNYDPALAKKLLGQAGYPNGFSFNLLVGQSFHQAEQVMQAQLKKIGVNMKMDIEENTVVYTKRVAGNFQASFSQIQSGLPDPTQFLIDYLTPNGQTNPGHLTIPGIEKDVATLQSSTDEATQAAAMADASTKALQAGTPVIPICSDEVITGFKSNVHGVTIPIDYDFDLSTISMS